MRAFIAVDLDPELKRALQELILKLKKTGADVRWVGASGMHLTLKFLGEIGPDLVPAVETVVRTAAAAAPRFSLVLAGTGTFPGAGNPRVIWAGFREAPALISLQRAIEDGLEAAGFPREERDFHPHLTLGRVKSRTRVREVLLELEKFREIFFGEMTAGKVTLFESVLKPQGAEYRAAAEFDLP
jgi:RNA 2',3'-cyclic 3'-phosphodiesterase